MTELEELCWVVQLGWQTPEVRDELLVQLVKQLTDNPGSDSRFRAWQMLVVILTTGFPPSKELLTPLQSWIEDQVERVQQRPGSRYGTDDTQGMDDGSPFGNDGATEEEAEAMRTVIVACTTRFTSLLYHGPPPHAPTTQSVVAALESPFNPCVFGLSLHTAMQVQGKVYPDAPVPVLLSFCADAMLALDATSVAGVWTRDVPRAWTQDLVGRIDRGEYTLDDLPPDPALPRAVLMLYVGSLTPVLLPPSVLAATAHSSSPSHTILARLILSLPHLTRRVTLFILSFLQLFCTPTSTNATGTTVSQLAQMWAPVLFGPDPTQDRSQQVTFVEAALRTLNCARIDSSYVPTHSQRSQRFVGSSALDDPLPSSTPMISTDPLPQPKTSTPPRPSSWLTATLNRAPMLQPPTSQPPALHVESATEGETSFAADFTGLFESTTEEDTSLEVGSPKGSSTRSPSIMDRFVRGLSPLDTDASLHMGSIVASRIA